MEGAHSPGSIRLAVLMAGLSLATDLGLGQPLQHELGVCLAALELADRLGCSTEERGDVYYVALVAHVGCTGAAGLLAEWAGGDDIHFQPGAQLLGAVSEPSEDLRYFLRQFADDRPLPERVWLRGRMLVGGNAQQNERRARSRIGDVKPQAIDRRVAMLDVRRRRHVGQIHGRSGRSRGIDP